MHHTTDGLGCKIKKKCLGLYQTKRMAFFNKYMYITIKALLCVTKLSTENFLLKCMVYL